MRQDLHQLKETLLIPEVWQRLGLAPRSSGKHHHGSSGDGVCRSPFRKDAHPSFSIYDGGRRWRDFGTGESGDVIDFIAMAGDLDKAEAMRRFLTMAGVPPEPSPWTREPARSRAAKPPRTGSVLLSTLQPLDLHRGTPEEFAQVAASRHLDAGAASAAQALLTLVFGTVCGLPSWILTDASGRTAEARTLDARPFPAFGTLCERKAHTLKGSHKDWPVGVAVLKKQPQFRAIMLVEGGPDYLAALHFCLTQDAYDVLPVAMLGRSSGSRIDPMALELMRGRCVRLYPHADADGGGLVAAKLWARQLHEYGCTLDIYSFAGLVRDDGQPVKDLNDCTRITPNKQQTKLKQLIP